MPDHAVIATAIQQWCHHLTMCIVYLMVDALNINNIHSDRVG